MRYHVVQKIPSSGGFNQLRRASFGIYQEALIAAIDLNWSHMKLNGKDMHTSKFAWIDGKVVPTDFFELQQMGDAELAEWLKEQRQYFMDGSYFCSVSEL